MTEESKTQGGRPSLLSAAQQAELDRQRAASGAAPIAKTDRRQAQVGLQRRNWLFGGSIAVLAAFVGVSAWLMNDVSSDAAMNSWVRKPAAAPVAVVQPVAAAPAVAAEAPPVDASPLAAAITDERPADKDMPQQTLKQMLNAEPAPKAGPDVLSQALEAEAPRKRAEPKLAKVDKVDKDEAKPRAKVAGNVKPAPVKPAKAKPAEPDSDVALLAALVAHTHSQPEARKAAARTQEQLRQCRQKSEAEEKECQARACEGRWKTDAACKALNKPAANKTAAAS